MSMRDRPRNSAPIQIGSALQKVMQGTDTSRPSRPAGRAAENRGQTPLTENGFTAIPRALDDLAVQLSRRRDGRTLARTLMVVVMDLTRYTDNVHGDVIVTNRGIVERRGVSLSSVKATIKLLLELHVLRKTEPADERLFQLQQVPGGFTRRRRYLVWNTQAMWRLPDSDEGLEVAITLWNDFVCKADVAEMRDQGKGSPRSLIPAGEEVFAKTSF